MKHCKSCKGSCHSCGGCAGCSGCANTLTLSEGEIQILSSFAQFSFLPVARNPDDINPVYLEDENLSQEEASLILSCLEKKGLIDIDYHTPLSGFSYHPYREYPVHGSMALTGRGQTVIELLELQGFKNAE